MENAELSRCPFPPLRSGRTRGTKPASRRLNANALGLADSSMIPYRLLLAKTAAGDCGSRPGVSSLLRQQEAQAMRMQVRKWGNSVAIRIPRLFAEDADVQEETSVDLCVSKSQPAVAPIRHRKAILQNIKRKHRYPSCHAEP
jgi:antitoxin MazE